MNLKQTLLDLGVFIDNEYLDFYCQLIESNIEKPKQSYLTQLHHVIPLCYYKIANNCKTRKECENFFKTDSTNFTVNLLYRDHILAHCYLCFCTTGLFYYKLLNSYSLVLNSYTTKKTCY